MTSIQYLLDNCGLKARRGEDGNNRAVESVLQDFMIEGSLLPRNNFSFPVHNINDALAFEINPDVFDVVDNFTKLTFEEYDILVRSNPESLATKKELLCLYLYTKSYCRFNGNGSYDLGFIDTLDNVLSNIKIRDKARLIKLYSILVDKGLLTKYIVGSREKKNGVRVNVPNVYIPCLHQDKASLDKAFEHSEIALKEFYKVDEFYPFLEKS